ncbi:MAG: DUF481 domain-containing protein [Verrucomicrobiota bacterium]
MPSCPSHKYTSLKCWALFILLAWSGCLLGYPQAFILHLRNGDRISGRLVSETTNDLVLATDFSTNLSIPVSLIERREAVPPVPTSTNRPPVPATGIAGELVLTNKPSMAQAAGGAAKPPAAKIEPIPPSALRKFLSEWRGEAQLGANLAFSTKDREAFTGRFRTTHDHGFSNARAIRNIIDYDVSYGTTENVLSDNRMEGSWKTEYDLNQRFLLYNVSRAGYDEIRGIDLQYDVGPGLGYKWIVLTNFVFKNELGGDYQKQFFIGDKTASRYSLRFAEDLWWQITSKIRVDERLEFFPEIQEFSNYRLRLEANLSYLLRQNLTLSLNVVDLYDTAVPSGVSRNDLQIRSLLGIRF